ncbi:hypothetical protein ACB098_01G083500 [Castanea mollissima]
MSEAKATGTLKVLKACVEAKVKRVVFLSSIATLLMNPSWPKGQVMDETSWFDKEYFRTTKLSKIEAESKALNFAKRSGLDVVTVCPSIVLGPILQPTVPAGGNESIEDKLSMLVDPEAEGRYICLAHMINAKDLVDLLKSIHPNYNYPKTFTQVRDEKRLSSKKLQKLAWSFKPLKETLNDAIESYRNARTVD